MAYTLNPDDKFGVKDTLAEGHPEKKILGVEFDDEFNKISTAIETIEGDVQNILLTGFPEPPESDPADPKVYARTYYDVDPGDDVPATGDWVEAPTFAEFSVLKDQVNNLDPDGDNSIQWDEIKEKPDTFPPEDHTHQIEDIEGLEDALANAVPKLDYTLPVALRSGVVQLPLTVDGTKLAVMTRGGELELPLAA